MERKEETKHFPALLGRWIPNLIPQILAFASFVGGAILLFSGAVASETGRLAWLKDAIPLPVIEISHFLGSVTGMLLLLLGRGLQRRLNAAYFLTAILLGGGILFSLLKGFDYEEAIFLSIMLLALLPFRNYFYRRASLTEESFTPAWTASIMIVIIATWGTGLFFYKHVEYSNDLWWRFAFFENAPRFLRAMVGIVGVSLFFALSMLLKPARIKPKLPQIKEMGEARAIARESKRCSSFLALLGDKALLFSQTKRSFIMYGVYGRSWVVLGDPVGPREEWGELIWKFYELCDIYDGWPVFWEIPGESLHFYLDLGLTLLKIGEEGKVPLGDFSLEGSSRSELRQLSRYAEKEGCVFEIIPPESVPAFLPEFKKISDDWLTRKHTKEKSFSLASFKEDYLKEFSFAVVKKEGRVIAFGNLWFAGDREEFSLDLMRYSSEAPRNVMDYLFVQSMLWESKEGYRWFNLGMAPLAGLKNRQIAPLWNRIGSFIFRYGEHFYNFQGVRLFKDKFQPAWEPKYLASPGGLALPQIFADIAALSSGGLRGIFGK